MNWLRLLVALAALAAGAAAALWWARDTPSEPAPFLDDESLRQSLGTSPHPR